MTSMHRFLACLFVVLVVVAAVDPLAQSTPPPAGESRATRDAVVETPHLTLTTAPRTAAGAAASRVALFLDIVPKPKMHVYAPNQKDYIPVTVTLERGAAFRAMPPVFPTPEKYFFAPLKETQLVYSKPFRIVQPVTVMDVPALRAAGQGPPSTFTIAGKLRYQACDDAICYFPKEVPVSWTVKVTSASIQ
jgi:hypothetical protein